MKKKIIFLNPSWEQKELVKEIKKLDIEILGIGNDAPSYINILDRFISCDINDINSIFDIAKTNLVNGIISDNCDYSLLTSELTCELLGLPTLGIEAAKTSNNKIKQRQLLSQSDVLQPDFKELNNLKDAIKFRNEISRTAIIKPADSRGSIGITYIDENANDDDVSKAIAFALTISPSRKCLIEKYINGKLITIDGFMSDGNLLPVAIAERERTSKGLIVTKSIKYNSDLNTKTKNDSIRFLNLVSKNLGYKNGHVHCEAIIDSQNKIWLVECTNRGAGVFTSSIINPFVSNHPLNRYLIDLKLGKDPQVPINKLGNFHQKDASLIFPSLGSTGQILFSYNPKKIFNNPKVLSFQLFSKVGRPLPEQHDGPSRHFAISISSSKDEEINEIIEEIKRDCFVIS